MLAVMKNYKLCDDIVLRSINNKFWALNVNTGNQYKLNELSYLILNEIVQPNNVDKIVQAIITSYNVSAKEAASDCISLLADAINLGLAEEAKI